MEKILKSNFSIGLLAFVMVLFNACHGRADAVITGTYVNHASSEFSIADDTLIVEHDQEQHYIIHRKTGFKILDDKGKPGKLQQDKEVWKAVYEADKSVLTESRKGLVISFFTGGLMLENSQYRRIN